MRQLRDRHSTQYRRRSTGELKEEEEEEEEYECEETALDKGVIRQFYPFSSENRVNQPSGTIFCCYNSLLPHNCAGRNVAELPLLAATVACRPRQSLIYMYLKMQSDAGGNFLPGFSSVIPSAPFLFYDRQSSLYEV